MRRLTLAVLSVTGLFLARDARALAIVTASSGAASVSVGDSFAIDIHGSLSDLTVGFGIDLTYDATRVTRVAPPLIGPMWLGVGAADGDGLAGLAPSVPGISGNDILLARLEFEAIAPGPVLFTPGVTIGDLAEGFALYPVGFEASLEFHGVTVVVPEPGLGPLCLAALLALRLTRPTRAAP